MEIPKYRNGVPIAYRAISKTIHKSEGDGLEYSICKLEVMLNTAADPENQQGNTYTIDLNERIGNSGGFFDVTRAGGGFLEGAKDCDFDVDRWTLTARLPTHGQEGEMGELLSINLNYFLMVIDDKPEWIGLSPNIRDTCELFTLTIDRTAGTAIYMGRVLGPSGQWNLHAIDLQKCLGYGLSGFYKRLNPGDKGLLDSGLPSGSEFYLDETGYNICVGDYIGPGLSYNEVTFDLSTHVANLQGELGTLKLDEYVEPITSAEEFALNYPGASWYEVVKYGAQGKWDQAKFYFAKGQYTAAVWVGAAVGEYYGKGRPGRIIGTIIGTIVGLAEENLIALTIDSGQVRAAIDAFTFKNVVREAIKNVLGNETASAFSGKAVKEAKLLWKESGFKKTLTEKTAKTLEKGFGEATAGPASIQTEDLMKNVIDPILDKVFEVLEEIHDAHAFILNEEPKTIN